jgi:hypothetical protein
MNHTYLRKKQPQTALIYKPFSLITSQLTVTDIFSSGYFVAYEDDLMDNILSH